MKVVALTFDGSPTNMSMLRTTFQSVFLINGQPIHCFLDPCHALKVARNTLARLGVIHVPGFGPDRWSHIVRLNNLQKSQGLNADNKLSDRHIKFEQQKMKVSSIISTQTIKIYILIC